MIEQLSVKDYVLFESCIIDFTNGMSVITGETGAGKSLLIDAIGYLSGDRIKSNVIRNGKDKAILSMVLTSNEKVNSILEENGFEVDDQVIISRTILNNNKSTVRINQQITTLSFVRKIVNLLVDVHSQMDTYRLTDTKLQMELLDSYAKVEDLKSSVKEAYFSYSNVLNELGFFWSYDLTALYKPIYPSCNISSFSDPTIKNLLAFMLTISLYLSIKQSKATLFLF